MKSKQSKVLRALFGLYCIALFVILFARRRFDIGRPYWEEVQMSINLVPFKSIRENLFYITHDTGGYMFRLSLVNLLGNIALFLPFGLCAPRLFERPRRFRMFLPLTLCLLLAVETLQVLTLRGSFDVDDILLNLSGAVIGFFLSKIKI